MNGVMGVANAQRALNHIRALAEFISRPENAEVVQAFSILNEPYMPAMSPEALKSFYLEAYKTIREASGFGEGKGPVSDTSSASAAELITHLPHSSSSFMTASRARDVGTTGLRAPTEWLSIPIATSPSALPTSTTWAPNHSSRVLIGVGSSIARCHMLGWR